MDQTNIYKSSPDNKDSPKSQYLTTVVPANKKALTLEGGHSMKNCGMWNLKYKTSSPKLYELLIKIGFKGDTYLYLKNFYRHIRMCLNAVTRLREDLLPSYQFIKRHSEFEGYFVKDHDHPYYLPWILAVSNID